MLDKGKPFLHVADSGLERRNQSKVIEAGADHRGKNSVDRADKGTTAETGNFRAAKAP